jgi:hypothetical protein
MARGSSLGGVCGDLVGIGKYSGGGFSIEAWGDSSLEMLVGDSGMMIGISADHGLESAAAGFGGVGGGRWSSRLAVAGGRRNV